MHRLIVGQPGIGKSTLIQKILDRLKVPVYGFYTKKEAPDKAGKAFVYIHAPTLPRRYDKMNQVGMCGADGAIGFPEAFDRAAALLRNIPPNGLVVMDELGMMESEAADFCRAVLDVLDSDATVIAAVKPKNTSFLEKVRTHSQARIYPLTTENRDTMFQSILDDIMEGKRT